MGLPLELTTVGHKHARERGAAVHERTLDAIVVLEPVGLLVVGQGDAPEEGALGREAAP